MTRREFLAITPMATLAVTPLSGSGVRQPRDPRRPIFRKGREMLIYIPGRRSASGNLQLFAKNDLGRLALIDGARKVTWSASPFRVVRDQYGALFTEYTKSDEPAFHNCAIWIRDYLGDWWIIYGTSKVVDWKTDMSKLGRSASKLAHSVFKFTPMACQAKLSLASFLNSGVGASAESFSKVVQFRTVSGPLLRYY